MTVQTSTQTTDHMIQICRERSARGVATRADWQRLAELAPDRAYRELKDYLRHSDTAMGPNPYDTSRKFRLAGTAVGFFLGVVFMAAWWWFGDYLQREVVTTARQWDIVTFTQYVAASLLPFFAWLGWRWDARHKNEVDSGQLSTAKLENASFADLLTRFDATRKAGGTRMY